MSDEAKVVLTQEQRYEKRKALLQLLLILLVGISVVYIGFELGVGVLALGVWLISRFTGGA